MLDRDGLRNFLNNNLTYGLERKDTKEKKIDSWPLYLNQSYRILKRKVHRPPLKLHIGELTMDANTSREGTDLKISFPFISGFSSLFIVAATKSGDQPSDETWLYFKNCVADTPNHVGFVCHGLFEEGNSYVILPRLYVNVRIQVQLVSNSKLEPNRVCPSFRLHLIFPLYRHIGGLLELLQKAIVKQIEEFELKPNWSSFLVHIDLKENKQILWMSKSVFLEYLIDYFESYFDGYYLLFDLAHTGCFKYVFSNVPKGKTALVKNMEVEGQFRLNDFLFKDALEEVKKSMRCDRLPIPHNTDCVMPMEKTLFVNGSNVFQSYFVLRVLMQSYEDYVNFLPEETKAAEIEQSSTEGIEGVTIETEQPDPTESYQEPESDPTGSNQAKHDEPESDPAYEQYLARVVEYDVLHLLYVAIVNEVGTM